MRAATLFALLRSKRDEPSNNNEVACLTVRGQCLTVGIRASRRQISR
jgi:hypothetical protein